MPGREIWHEMKVNASPGAVYQALTNVEQLAQWWIPDTRGESTIGKALEFWMGEFCQVMQVTAVQPDQLVRWQPTEKGLPDWVGTQLEFTIHTRQDQTFIQLRHSGYRDDIEGFPYYSMSWAIRLISFKELLEKGKGRPFPTEWD